MKPIKASHLSQFLMLVVLFLTLSGGLISAADVDSSGEANPVEGRENYEEYQLQFLALINNERVQNGLTPLTMNARLTEAALVHAQDMDANDFLDHVGSDGSTFTERVAATRYDWRYLGEAVFAGSDSAQIFFSYCQANARFLTRPYPYAGWMWTEIGIGRSGGYWTVVVGRPDGKQSGGGGGGGQDRPTPTPTAIPTETLPPTLSPTQAPTEQPTQVPPEPTQPPAPTAIPTIAPEPTQPAEPELGCQKNHPERLDCSSLAVSGSCSGTTAVFTITNTGEPGDGNMRAATGWRLIDSATGNLLQSGAIQLAGGASMMVTYDGGVSVRLEADQQIGHPGHSQPQATLSCGH